MSLDFNVIACLNVNNTNYSSLQSYEGAVAQNWLASLVKQLSLSILQ